MRRTYRYSGGRIVEVGERSPESAATKNVGGSREFQAFVSHQIDLQDPAIEKAGLKRNREGEPIFESRRQVREFQAASHGELGGGRWVFDGMDTKSRRPKLPPKPPRVFTGRTG